MKNLSQNLSSLRLYSPFSACARTTELIVAIRYKYIIDSFPRELRCVVEYVLVVYGMLMHFFIGYSRTRVIWEEKKKETTTLSGARWVSVTVERKKKLSASRSNGCY